MAEYDGMGGWTVDWVSEVILHVWRRTDHWGNKCVAGWWTEWLEVLLDGRHWMSGGCSGWLKSGLVSRMVLFTCTLTYCTAKTLYQENSKQIFPEMKLRGLVPNSYIHVSVSDVIYSHDRSAYIWTFCGNI